MSESVSRGPWYGEIFTILKLVLSKAWGNEKAWHENKQSNSVPRWRRTLGKLQHHRQLPAVGGGLSAFQTFEIRFLPFSEHWAEGHSRGYTCAGDLHSERGIMGEMKCMKCLGSGQQFTGALAAKERTLVLSGLRPTFEERTAATAGMKMLLHLLQAPPAQIPLPTFREDPKPLARQREAGRGQTTLSRPQITTSQRDRVTGHSRW